RKNEMPPPMYLLTHPEAKLTDAEKQQLIEGLGKSLR
ncbi:MAG: heme-binding domain-containing protein, partial [Chloroflexi bacterium]|nr:heme-binding domain-containing protein [Chloroflexota bacterium]